MDVLRRMRRRDWCAHPVAVTVQSTGIERVVCEACGHVSVHFLSGLTGEVDRDRFARPIERGGRHQRAGEESVEQPLADALSDAPVPGHNPFISGGAPWGEPEPD